jgi:hypothetical protein
MNMISNWFSTRKSSIRPKVARKFVSYGGENLESRVCPAALVDFSLPDINETSATSGQNISPRDYLGQVSAWYFGHAT